MLTILIIEDDQMISRVIELQLTHAGYAILKAFDGVSGLECFEKNKDTINLVLLDIMMPLLDGYHVLDAIKKKAPKLPVIFLTAKDDVEDVVLGLNQGADDYIKKPFNAPELLARINANLRKQDSSSDDKILTYEDLTLNLTDFSASRNKVPIHLSRTEFDLLHYLLLNHNLVQTREQILNHVWGYDYYGNDNIVDVYIKYLRDKIDKPYERKLIQTVRGRGYVIK